MIRSPLTIVVGAGASAEFNIPVSAGLKKEIADSLNLINKSNIREKNLLVLRNAIQKISNDENSYHNLNSEISTIVDALPLAISIDNLIDAHNSNELLKKIGKLSIVNSIIKLEGQSIIYKALDREKRNLNFDKFSETWINFMFQILTERVNLHNIEHIFDNICFVVFNYDRCIEYFFFHAIKSYYKLNDSQCIRILNKMKIVHVYGKTGPLLQENHEDGIGFGEINQLDEEKLINISNNISTFTESVSIENSKTAKNFVESAETIIFLGISYNDQNMEIIRPQKCKAKRIFGTACRMSNFDIASIKKTLKNWANFDFTDDQLIILNAECCHLYQQLSRTIFRL